MKKNAIAVGLTLLALAGCCIQRTTVGGNDSNKAGVGAGIADVDADVDVKK